MWYVKLFPVHTYILYVQYIDEHSLSSSHLLAVPLSSMYRLGEKFQATSLSWMVDCCIVDRPMNCLTRFDAGPKIRQTDLDFWEKTQTTQSTGLRPVVGWFLWFGGLVVCFSLSYFVWCFLSFFSCHMPMRLMIVSCPVAPKQQNIGFLNP